MSTSMQKLEKRDMVAVVGGKMSLRGQAGMAGGCLAGGTVGLALCWCPPAAIIGGGVAFCVGAAVGWSLYRR
jgi:hypothetical protein